MHWRTERIIVQKPTTTLPGQKKFCLRALSISTRIYLVTVIMFRTSMMNQDSDLICILPDRSVARPEQPE